MAVKAKADPLAAQIDELGALEKELAPFKAKIARVEALRKAFRGLWIDVPAEKSFEQRGLAFGLTVGARGFERKVDEPGLIKAIGVKRYAAIAHVTLGAVEENVAPATAAGVISTAQTGPRRMSTFELVKTP